MFKFLLACLFPLLTLAVTTQTHKISHNKYLIQYEFEKLELIDGGIIDGKHYQQINLRGNFLPAKPGTPNIPIITKYIAIPKNASITTRVIKESKGYLRGIRIAPAPEIQNDLSIEPMRVTKDPTIYSYNANYPTKPLEGEIKKIRGLDMAEIAVSSGQHNPVEETYSYYKSLTLEIEVKSRNETIGDQRLRSYWWDPIIKDIIENPEELPEIELKKESTRTNQDFEYLIVIPPNKLFKKYATKLKEWRTLQGIRTGIITTDQMGGNNSINIQNFIRKAYANWKIPPVAILLLGDFEEITSPLYNNYCRSDNIYADTTGDHLPDIVVARISAHTKNDLKNSINKIINFEKKPPHSEHYYQTPITAMGWEFERWFQIGAESINGFYKQVLNKDPVRLYAHNAGTTNQWSNATNTKMVMDYFGSNGLGYIPDSPDYLTNWETTPEEINEAIEKGSFLVLHRDHGESWGWKHPYYTTSSVKKLENKDPTFILSINCLTGKFDDETPSFTETMIRHEKGAIGVVAASHASSSFVNDTMLWGLYDFMWPNFLPELGKNKNSPSNLMPAFALTASKYFLQRSSWPKTERTKEETYHLFHYHGDAFTRLNWKKPTKIYAKHKNFVNAGAMEFQIESEYDAFIALTQNGKIVARAEGGATATLALPPQIPGDKLILTITKQNRLRYQKSIRITPGVKPMVIMRNATTPKDGEIKIELKNVSLLLARGFSAKVRSLSSYATIEGEISKEIPTLFSLASKSLNWKIQIDEKTPHQFELPFQIIIRNKKKQITMQQEFTLEIEAPLLELTPLITGCHDIVAGETQTVSYTLINSGKKSAFNININILKNGKIMASTVVTKLDPESRKVIALPIPFDEDDDEVSLTFRAQGSNTPLFEKNHLVTIGITEDFEFGHFLGLNWGYTETAWIIEKKIPFAGNFSVRSGLISNREKSSLIYKVNLPKGGTISFMKKISSAKWDNLTFYIGGKFMDDWDGEIEWSKSEYDIPAGEHLLKWVYTKSSRKDEGLDAAFLDNITVIKN